MSELKAMSAVYCYFFPEAWDHMQKVSKALTRDIFKVDTPVEVADKAIEGVFSTEFKFPSKKDGLFEGCVDLDELFLPVGQRIIEVYRPNVTGIDNFDFLYPSPGSSEGIFKVLTKLKVDGEKSIFGFTFSRQKTINVLSGEYEGYREYGGKDDLGMRIKEHDLEKLRADKIRPGYWFKKSSRWR